MLSLHSGLIICLIYIIFAGLAACSSPLKRHSARNIDSLATCNSGPSSSSSDITHFETLSHETEPAILVRAQSAHSAHSVHSVHSDRSDRSDDFQYHLRVNDPPPPQEEVEAARRTFRENASRHRKMHAWHRRVLADSKTSPSQHSQQLAHLHTMAKEIAADKFNQIKAQKEVKDNWQKKVAKLHRFDRHEEANLLRDDAKSYHREWTRQFNLLKQITDRLHDEAKPGLVIEEHPWAAGGKPQRRDLNHERNNLASNRCATVQGGYYHTGAMSSGKMKSDNERTWNEDPSPAGLQSQVNSMKKLDMFKNEADLRSDESEIYEEDNDSHEGTEVHGSQDHIHAESVLRDDIHNELDHRIFARMVGGPRELEAAKKSYRNTAKWHQRMTAQGQRSLTRPPTNNGRHKTQLSTLYKLAYSYCASEQSHMTQALTQQGYLDRSLHWLQGCGKHSEAAGLKQEYNKYVASRDKHVALLKVVNAYLQAHKPQQQR